MNNPLHHTALLLRTILVVLVIVTQVFIPAGAAPLTCPVSCVQETAASTTGAECCENSGQDDCAGDARQSASRDAHSRECQTSCGLYGCHFCAFVMIVDMERMHAAQPPTALFFPPATLGDPANPQPPPPDHPPC